MIDLHDYEELLEAIMQTDVDAEEFIKDAAMARCSVKLSRRPHVRDVLDQAFTMLRERAANYKKASSGDLNG